MTEQLYIHLSKASRKSFEHSKRTKTQHKGLIDKQFWQFILEN